MKTNLKWFVAGVLTIIGGLWLFLNARIEIAEKLEKREKKKRKKYANHTDKNYK